jgi:DNA-binding LacI/PurR family transcriptional regulator
VAPRPHPALDRAVELLLALVHGAGRSRERLPGIRSLAAQAGVSHVTMWKAVHVLAGRGLLRTVPERQILVAGAIRTPPSLGTPRAP